MTTTAVFAERVARSRPERPTGTIAARQCRSSQCHQLVGDEQLERKCGGVASTI